MPEIVPGIVQAFYSLPEQFPAQFWVLNFLMPEAGCFNNQWYNFCHYFCLCWKPDA
jgi:hypothetical protein